MAPRLQPVAAGVGSAPGVDEGRNAYRVSRLLTLTALALRPTPWQVMGPPVIAPDMRAASRGHYIERPVGDVMQLPGTFIIDRDGIVRWAKVAQHAADHPSVGEIVAALREMQRQ